MKPSPLGILSILAVDFMGFGILVMAALVLGIATNCFRHAPLPLISFLPIIATENPLLPAPAEISLATLQDESSRHKIQLIDVRPVPFYQLGHIPGAINVPVADLQGISTTENYKLPFSKLDPVVVYCADVSCPAAKSAARKLESLGFSNVMIFSGGWYVWKRADLPVETTP